MKHDSKYVAKVEHAITEKYGKEAVTHPRAEWTDEQEKEYLEQLKKLAKQERAMRERHEKVDAGGFLVSKKLLNKDSSRVCPVCNAYSFSIGDDVIFAKHGCCSKCYNKKGL